MPLQMSGLDLFSNLLLINLVQNFFVDKSSAGNMFSSIDNLLLILGIVILIALIPLINKLFTNLNKIVESWCFTNLQVVRIQNLELVVPHRFTNTLVLLVKYLKTVVLIVVIATILTFVFSIFPGTQGIVLALFDKFVVILNKLWEELLAFLPSLLGILVIAFITYITLKLLRFFSDGFKQGKIKIFGVHPELVEPTFQLLRFLVVGIALVATYPYIPGSSSPVFRGVSIFVGFLLSLGSTSLVANIVSGVVLTYTRGLKIGDRVEIGDAVGDVVDRNLLVTRIRTIKNVVITIPNGMVLNNHVINYSASTKKKGLILNTSVTIGYDAPWRKVHQLLVDAARATRGILETPKPFVYQTGLDDFYVSYELNAYTRNPARMADIYSELHQNIQDKFNEASIEIMSPSYTALRDGNRAAVPPEYRSVGYMTNVFRTFSPEDTRPLP